MRTTGRTGSGTLPIPGSRDWSHASMLTGSIGTGHMRV